MKSERRGDRMSKVAIILSEEAYALSKEILSKLLLLMSKEKLPATAKSNLRNLRKIIDEINKVLKELEVKYEL